MAIEFEPQLASQVSASAADFAPAVVKVASAPAELTVEAVEVEPAVESLLPSFDGEVGELGEVGRGGGRTRVFGLAGEGSKFVYVLDRSSSMTTTFRLCEKDRPVRDLAPLGLAKNELVRSLRELNPQQQFQIVFYNMRSVVFGENPYVQELLPANDELKAEAERFVADLPGLGGTNHLGALQTALKLQPDE